MRKIIIEDISFRLKNKTVLNKITKREDAIDNFQDFIKEYTTIENSEVILKYLEKEQIVDYILSFYDLNKDSTFIKYSNEFIERRNTVNGYMIDFLNNIGYKVSDIIKLNSQELFETFTYEFRNKICLKDQSLAKSIGEELIMFGLDRQNVMTYINNLIPKNEEQEIEVKKNNNEVEDVANLIASLEKENL